MYFAHSTIKVIGLKEQGRQYTYNVSLRRVRATIFAVEKQQYYLFSVRVCRFSYPACNACAPYCHLCPTLLYYIFPYYFTNGKIFGKRV
jgi:hypothetical protein